jgi:hypothetical protein
LREKEITMPDIDHNEANLNGNDEMPHNVQAPAHIVGGPGRIENIVVEGYLPSRTIFFKTFSLVS